MSDSLVPRARRYGLIPDHRDQRDVMFAPRPGITLPTAASTAQWLPPVLDQGQAGACTGHGTSEAMRAVMIKDGAGDAPLSRLFPYFNGRVIEGTTDQDAGAMIRDVIKALAKLGCAREEYCPYDVAAVCDKPSQAAYADGLNCKVLRYERVAVSTLAIKQAIASGYPVVIGISVYESFESDAVARTGIVPMPGETESLLGGHCMIAFGYDNATQMFDFRNSWGAGWGDHGNGKLPFAYLGSDKYASDLWAITSVSAPAKSAAVQPEFEAA